MAYLLRRLVSQKKRRFILDDFDLDLAYITANIIAMGWPGEGSEGLYRNPRSEVARMLNQYHKGHYRVYNLCSERTYDHAAFDGGDVREFKCHDHQVPPLSVLLNFCRDAEAYLREDDKNTVVVHCKAGKGRTGMCICCLLVFMGLVPDWEAALKLYAARRTVNGKGVTICSQRRWCRYFALAYQLGCMPEGPRMPLASIHIRGLTAVLAAGIVIVVQQRLGNSLATRTVLHAAFPPALSFESMVCGSQGQARAHEGPGWRLLCTSSAVDLFFTPPPEDTGKWVVQGDFKVHVYVNRASSKNSLFWCWLNTAFLPNNAITLGRRELDKVKRQVPHGVELEINWSMEPPALELSNHSASEKACEKGVPPFPAPADPPSPSPHTTSKATAKPPNCSDNSAAPSTYVCPPSAAAGADAAPETSVLALPALHVHNHSSVRRLHRCRTDTSPGLSGRASHQQALQASPDMHTARSVGGGPLQGLVREPSGNAATGPCKKRSCKKLLSLLDGAWMGLGSDRTYDMLGSMEEGAADAGELPRKTPAQSQASTSTVNIQLATLESPFVDGQAHQRPPGASSTGGPTHQPPLPPDSTGASDAVEYAASSAETLALTGVPSAVVHSEATTEISHLGALPSRPSPHEGFTAALADFGFPSGNPHERDAARAHSFRAFTGRSNPLPVDLFSETLPSTPTTPAGPSGCSAPLPEKLFMHAPCGESSLPTPSEPSTPRAASALQPASKSSSSPYTPTLTSHARTPLSAAAWSESTAASTSSPPRRSDGCEAHTTPSDPSRQSDGTCPLTAELQNETLADPFPVTDPLTAPEPSFLDPAFRPPLSCTPHVHSSQRDMPLSCSTPEVLTSDPIDDIFLPGLCSRAHRGITRRATASPYCGLDDPDGNSPRETLRSAAEPCRTPADASPVSRRPTLPQLLSTALKYIAPLMPSTPPSSTPRLHTQDNAPPTPAAAASDTALALSANPADSSMSQAPSSRLLAFPAAEGLWSCPADGSLTAVSTCGGEAPSPGHSAHMPAICARTNPLSEASLQGDLSAGTDAFRDVSSLLVHVADCAANPSPNPLDDTSPRPTRTQTPPPSEAGTSQRRSPLRPASVTALPLGGRGNSVPSTSRRTAGPNAASKARAVGNAKKPAQGGLGRGRALRRAQTAQPPSNALSVAHAPLEVIADSVWYGGSPALVATDAAAKASAPAPSASRGVAASPPRTVAGDLLWRPSRRQANPEKRGSAAARVLITDCSSPAEYAVRRGVGVRPPTPVAVASASETTG